jgi:hypothetical protein|tara:strand:+ start:5452 stop:5652 length:201 start_codon:yes stop_codon:yes gene_type:complete
MKNTKTFYVLTNTLTQIYNEPPSYIRKEILNADSVVPLNVQAAYWCEEMSRNGVTIVKSWWERETA